LDGVEPRVFDGLGFCGDAHLFLFDAKAFGFQMMLHCILEVFYGY
jgi:hypothetical protein